MAKYRIGIVFEYETDSNGYFDWEDEYEIEEEDKDEDFEPRSQSKLLELIKREFLEVIEQQDVSDMVTIEEVK
jgi:hypothetical protein